MKRFIVTATLIAAAFTTAIQAQTVTAVKAHVPFSFWVGNAEMPAGVYTVRRNATGTTVVIQKQDGKREAAVFVSTPTDRPKTSAPGTIDFTSYGGTYVLTGIWASDRNEGYKPPMTSHDREVAIASNGHPATTSVALGTR